MTETITHPLLDGVPHAFRTRAGGVSTGLYAGLNCGLGSGDDPADVRENRARVAAGLGVGAERLMTVHQVHSARALRRDAPWEAAPEEADALVSAAPDLAVAALAADCAPVLFADREAGVVAAAHAGWRGAVDGVLEAALDEMEAAGADRGRTVAVVGPCISQRNYEVGPEFVERFVDEDPETARFFAGGTGDRAMFDLPGFALHRLRAAGVAEAAWTGHCTYADEALFYSFRRATHRGEPDYGRLISAIRPPGD